MKKKLLGLGICALALGAFAGAVSAQRALETNAVDISSWSFVGTNNSWNFATNRFVLDGSVYKLTLELEADVEFKIAANNNWDDCVLSWQIADISSGHIAKDVGNDKNNKIVDAGTYTFEIKNTLTPDIAKDWEQVGDYISVAYAAPAVVYTAKLGDDAIALEEVAPSHEDMAAQYHAVIDADKDASITLYADGSLITANVASDDGSSVKYASAGVFNVHNDIEDADLYIKVWKSGYVTLWADGLVEYNGYYLLSSTGSFLVENGIASNGAHELNVATFINVALAKDEEIIIGKFTDGARDAEGTWQYDAGWSNVDSEHSDAIAKFEVGTDNHIKVKEAGQFCIYVHADKATFINNYQATDDDYAAVDEFVADYITEQAKEAKVGDSCETKYTEAAAALNALNEVQQDLFWKDAKYASARAAFEYWRDHRSDSTIYNIEGVVKKDNTALVVTLVALAGAAVVGASIFFATRKKHN